MGYPYEPSEVEHEAIMAGIERGEDAAEAAFRRDLNARFVELFRPYVGRELSDEIVAEIGAKIDDVLRSV